MLRGFARSRRAGAAVASRARPRMCVRPGPVPGLGRSEAVLPLPLSDVWQRARSRLQPVCSVRSRWVHISGSLRSWRSSPGYDRRFCGTCGGRVVGENGGGVELSIGSFDGLAYWLPNMNPGRSGGSPGFRSWPSRSLNTSGRRQAVQTRMRLRWWGERAARPLEDDYSATPRMISARSGSQQAYRMLSLPIFDFVAEARGRPL